jgi:hypothetical protein
VAHLRTLAAAMAAATVAAGGGAALLALIGLHQGRGADTSACTALSQPRVAGGGQRCLLCLAMAVQSSGVVWAAAAERR